MLLCLDSGFIKKKTNKKPNKEAQGYKHSLLIYFQTCLGLTFSQICCSNTWESEQRRVQCSPRSEIGTSLRDANKEPCSCFACWFSIMLKCQTREIQEFVEKWSDGVLAAVWWVWWLSCSGRWDGELPVNLWEMILLLYHGSYSPFLDGCALLLVPPKTLFLCRQSSPAISDE